MPTLLVDWKLMIPVHVEPLQNMKFCLPPSGIGSNIMSHGTLSDIATRVRRGVDDILLAGYPPFDGANVH